MLRRLGIWQDVQRFLSHGPRWWLVVAASWLVEAMCWVWIQVGHRRGWYRPYAVCTWLYDRAVQLECWLCEWYNRSKARPSVIRVEPNRRYTIDLLIENVRHAEVPDLAEWDALSDGVPAERPACEGD